MTERSGRVLVAGSINTDLVVRVRRAPEAGETVTGSSFEMFGGGKGANQAVATARSGARVAMLGALGRDAFGETRLRDLQAEGVETETVRILPDAPSGVASIVVEESGQNRIAYVPGATWKVTADQARVALDFWQPDYILATLELPREALALLFAEARDRGIALICNATPEPAEGADLALQADILVVNESEAMELLDDGAPGDDWAAVAEALRTRGPAHVLITLGKDGALLAGPDGSDRLAALPVEVVDTTGAGDAFCGAFVARLGEGFSLKEAAAAGVVAGSLATTRAGAQPSMPRREEIEGKLGQVTV